MKLFKNVLSIQRKKRLTTDVQINLITRDGKNLLIQLLSKFKKILIIFLPVGDGNILSGCIKGFLELNKLNYLKKFLK